LIARSLFRVLVTSAVLGAGALLAGCNSDDISMANNAKANKPIPPKLLAEMQKKDMDPQSPILVRLFKQEAELEVWKQNRSGKFALLETYPICRWSGDLGPKIREGDRQAPEGFYSITPAQMNPRSAYYQSLGRTGSELMVHGDCSSRGCYAMTDEQISDIYTLGRESFFGGQRAFQVQAYPFRMTPVNLAKHRNNPNMPFWKMLKVGYDHFEVTHQEPKVDFCDKKYVFDAAPPPGSTKPLTFNASAACPAYVVPPEIEAAVEQKERADDAKVAELIAKGTPVAKLNSGIDGGMNSVFAAKIPGAETGLSDPAAPGISLASAKAPGTIPPTVNPPHAQEEMVALQPAGEAPERTSRRVADAAPTARSGGFFNSLAHKMGLGDAGSDDAAPAAASTPAAVPLPPDRPKTMTAKRHAPHLTHAAAAMPRAAGPQEASHPKAKPSASTTATSAPARTASAKPDAKAADAKAADTMAGAQPVVSSNWFDSRFSAFR
jgi:murein L,D-transpeptidase YafK